MARPRTATVPVLPGVDVCAGIPREERLKLWMKDQGLSFSKIADMLGVHFSLPGKWWAGKEALPAERRRELVNKVGVPLDLLPWVEVKKDRAPRQ